jgi:hypothetical protein
LYIYQTILFIKTYGYLALHLGGTVPYHTLFKIVIIIATVGYTIFIASNPRSKWSYWIFTLIITITLLADGKRGPGLTLFVIAFWYYFFSNDKKIKVLLILIFTPLILLILILIGYLRFGISTYDNVTFNIAEFIYSQGVSINVISYAIKFDATIVYNLFDLIFSKIYQFFDIMYYKSIGISPDLSLVTRAEKYKIYSSYISYIVNSPSYRNGFGIGGSYIAQLYSVGKEFIQLLGGIFLGYTYSFISSWSYSKSQIKRGILLLIMPIIIYIPRDNMFDVLMDALLVVAIFIIIHFIKQLFGIFSKNEI